MTRLAIINSEDCKSKDCGSVCIKYCPVNLTGVKCITLNEKKIAEINEYLCNGCGICVKKCHPWDAIKIINLPENLDKDVTHRYGQNKFKLHRLPHPKKGNVIGLIGQNGAGKSTSLKILSGEIKPNLGKVGEDLEWDYIIKNYRGSDLQNYLKLIKDKKLKIVIKPQNVDLIPKVTKGVVKDLISKVDERGVAEELKDTFSLHKIWDRPISVLSGGELQRLAIAATLAKDADAYFIDEPTSYLDVRERLNVAIEIRKLSADKIFIVVEHDLAILDYLSDQVQLYYGDPGAYGVVTKPMSVKDGINVFLDGYIPAENMRFRSEPLKFDKTDLLDDSLDRRYPLITYGAMQKTYDTFHLEVAAGELYPGDIVGIIGPNGIGKSTFAKMIAGIETPTKINGEIKLIRKRITQEDDEEEGDVDDVLVENLQLTLSYKPQYLDSENTSTVEEYLRRINYK
ncbi:MAG: ribosome biogenesis/translation initiation ATPase RLI, partial [Candidatus Heimdallarchaeota archaeon]|nr:ribosome biogenesis/translation initiation ATPase RLI [Candidatus Heimdallarchaeota archaeon]